jgi:hypothetical protein
VGLHHRGIWVVVWLGSARASVLATDDLPKYFLGWWWRIASGIGGGFPAVAVAGAMVVGFRILVEMGLVVGIGFVEFGNVAKVGWWCSY